MQKQQQLPTPPIVFQLLKTSRCLLNCMVGNWTNETETGRGANGFTRFKSVMSKKSVWLMYVTCYGVIMQLCQDSSLKNSRNVPPLLQINIYNKYNT